VVERAAAEPVILEYFRAVNDEDWDALGRVWVDDCEMVAVGGPPRHGREDVVGAYRRFMEMFPTHRDEPERILVCGDTATVEVHFEAANLSGGRVELDCVDVIDFREGLFRRLTFWCDLDVLRRQL
jgi:ketosteroid isomerase-like protein